MSGVMDPGGPDTTQSVNTTDQGLESVYVSTRWGHAHRVAFSVFVRCEDCGTSAVGIDRAFAVRRLKHLRHRRVSWGSSRS